MGFLLGHSAWQIDQFPTCWPMNGLFVHWYRGWGCRRSLNALFLYGMYLPINISPWFYMGCIYQSISTHGFIWDVFTFQYLPMILYGMYWPFTISPWLLWMNLPINISPWFYMGCIYSSISPHGFIWDVFTHQYLPMVLYGMYLPINISPWFYMGCIYQSISPHGFIWDVFTL